MGDVGSTAIGFLFGVLPLLPGQGSVAFEPVALALSLFVLDATLTLLRRIARGERWYTPHRTHLYQRPVVAGAGHRSVLVSAFLGMLAVGACAASWPAASLAGRLGLASVPVALFAGGHWAVGRMERRVKPPA
jgi:UDP-N-acetylmuramyl pentapeptide phosphotransferase/UDP-N-acetylglucosamine-1-phosphate transferase